ncbi:MAG TPA: low molecular weight phosphatase family protein [Sulfurospirillum sp. UBA12182]|jgi:arsenate reductase|nr:MAG TPA: low molecular weight phosphatase family protein [Sulfurospirillum sp. UBA12182]
MSKVLFVCVHNSARSQMAEELLRKYGEGSFVVESAGLEPGVLNPLAIEVLKEEGIDISDKKPQSVFELFKTGHLYRYVITVCDESKAQNCPIFPGQTSRIHWSFEDPSSFEGSWEEKLEKTRVVKEKIKEKVLEFIKNHSK